MQKKFMIDIETTGVKLESDDIIQVAALEMIQEAPGALWVAGKSICFDQFTAKQPTSAFAKKHMVEQYKRANNTQPLHHEQAREMLVGLFAECGCQGAENVFLCGWNASNFDVPFLVRDKYLIPSDYVQNADGTESMIGDFHYRIYEMGGAIRFAEDLTGKKWKDELKPMVKQITDEMYLPEGKEHDALWDCYSQMNILNALNIVVQEVVIDRRISA